MASRQRPRVARESMAPPARDSIRQRDALLAIRVLSRAALPFGRVDLVAPCRVTYIQAHQCVDMLVTKGYVAEILLRDGETTSLELTAAGEAALESMDRPLAFDLSVPAVRVAWRAELRRRKDALHNEIERVRRATDRAERQGAA